MALSLGFIYLATRLARLWIKERRTSCLKIGGELSRGLLRSFIHYRTNCSSFFYPLASLKIGDKLSGVNCPGGKLSDIH